MFYTAALLVARRAVMSLDKGPVPDGLKIGGVSSIMKLMVQGMVAREAIGGLLMPTRQLVYTIHQRCQQTLEVGVRTPVEGVESTSWLP